MKIGFVGLGKLGLPVALAIEFKGHEVIGYDVKPHAAEILRTKRLPYQEVGAEELLQKSRMRLAPLPELVRESEIIFLCVQTPHQPLFEGVTPLPPHREDFDYTFLRSAVKDIVTALEAEKVIRIVTIISTVLPGTVERELKPIMTDKVKLCYNPLFAAMGTVVGDCLNPEFTLLGCDDLHAADTVEKFYGTIHGSPVIRTSIRTAELTKVAYNTFIGLKLSFASALLEISHKVGANVDDVTRALSHAKDRLISSKYLKAGMGDGGPCHPRDNIALSWLARKLELSHDIFHDTMLARENQTRWLADQLCNHDLPKVILGKAFKRGTNLTAGSPALLMAHILKDRGVAFTQHDPVVDGTPLPTFKPSAFFVATNHAEFEDHPYPEGSVVLDPWGYVKKRPGVSVVHLGR